MRLELLYNPRLLCERLAIASQRCRRLARLRHTVASQLTLGHIDSLELLELLRDKPPRVIYDIGANVGTWTLLAKATFPIAEVHAFEPLIEHIAGFKRGTKSMHDVYLHPVALGSEKCKRTMNVTSFSDASSLLEVGANMEEHFGITKSREESVTIERLDDYVVFSKLPQPNLIKLDVQGYELEALRGGLMALNKARAVLIEVSFVEFYSGQCLFEDVVSFLAQHGFRLRALGVNTTLGKPLTQTDALFLRNHG